MKYWDKILEELKQDKNDPSATYYFIHRRHDTGSKVLMLKVKPSKSPRKKYPLGKNFPNIALTYQEAACMRHALKGKTIPGIAVALKLSPRTVEYYFQKMRRKLNCNTKPELIEKISYSDFPNLI